MNCARFNECISLYIDNELETSEKIKFEEHIRECKNCRKKYNEMLSITKILNNEMEVDLPKNYNKILRKKLEEVNITKKRKIKLRKLTSVAAVFIVLITSIAILYENLGLNKREIALESKNTQPKIEEFALMESDSNAEEVLDDSVKDLEVKTNRTINNEKLVINKTLHLETEDINKTNEKIVDIVLKSNGFIEENKQNYIIARVKLSNLNEVIENVSNITIIKEHTTKSYDITNEYKDANNYLIELSETYEKEESIDKESRIFKDLLKKYDQMIEYPTIEFYLEIKK